MVLDNCIDSNRLNSELHFDNIPSMKRVRFTKDEIEALQIVLSMSAYELQTSDWSDSKQWKVCDSAMKKLIILAGRQKENNTQSLNLIKCTTLGRIFK